MSFDDLFLLEVRRRLPDDVDVVAGPAVDPGRTVDPRAAREEVEAADALAVETLVDMWRRCFPDLDAPSELRLRWLPTRRADAIGAEAATRHPGAAGAATARLEPIEALLAADGWRWTRRDPDGSGNVRLVGRHRRVGFDLGIRTDPDVVLLRTRTQPIVVGGLAAELIEAPADVRPWR